MHSVDSPSSGELVMCVVGLYPGQTDGVPNELGVGVEVLGGGGSDEGRAGGVGQGGLLGFDGIQGGGGAGGGLALFGVGGEGDVGGGGGVAAQIRVGGVDLLGGDGPAGDEGIVGDLAGGVDVDAEEGAARGDAARGDVAGAVGGGAGPSSFPTYLLDLRCSGVCRASSAALLQRPDCTIH